MILSSLIVGCFSLWGTAHALGQQPVIAFNYSQGNLKLAGPGTPAGTILLDSADWPAVLRAAGDLAADFGRVTGTNLTKTVINGTVASSAVSNNGPVIIAGTIGNSSLINFLVQSGKIDVSATEGQWEAFQTEIVDNPIPGISQALVISGSDKRGTIYGLYDISEQIGVSPWYWFADVAPAQHQEIYALNTKKVQGSPSVKYRGFFINDEAPALTN
ncbi:hypothetical protein VTN77DRAFT_6923 [Rasamsonia byssochlamydoides]|uniref:uncharacterized protein n=1 Tax=Rasamsonia byssochlamydoides TaxID=89139 RepID=UPI0037443BB7